MPRDWQDKLSIGGDRYDKLSELMMYFERLEMREKEHHRDKSGYKNLLAEGNTLEITTPPVNNAYNKINRQGGMTKMPMLRKVGQILHLSQVDVTRRDGLLCDKSRSQLRIAATCTMSS